jgi:hypothetical protein
MSDPPKALATDNCGTNSVQELGRFDEQDLETELRQAGVARALV